MTDLERKSASERLEQVFLPKIEASIRQEKPIIFTKEDVSIMREAFTEMGVEYNVSPEARERLLNGSKFRIKPKVSSEGKLTTKILIYDYEKPKGERWVDSGSYEDDRWLAFEEERVGGVYAMLGKKKLNKLINFCYSEAKFEYHYPGKIGGNAGTEGRGLQQTAADLLALTLLDEESEEYEQEFKSLSSRINRRFWKGTIKTVRLEEPKDIDTLEMKTQDEMADLLKDKLQKIGEPFRDMGIDVPSTTTSSFHPQALSDLVRFLASK